MALWTYALRTVAQVKTSLPLTGSGIDTLIEDCINEASAMVEDAWGRQIVSRGSLTEFHPRDPTAVLVSAPPLIYGYDPLLPASPSRPALYVNEWPIVSVTTVNEDSSRTYGGASLLAANTDYIVNNPVGKLTRVAGSLPRSWVWSWRAVKVVYIAGYQRSDGSIVGADAVPNGILGVFDDLVAWMISHRNKSEQGRASISDELGSRTFWAGPPMITDGMHDRLAAAGALRASLRGITGERDS
jgi:hypothetical protein